MGCSIFATSHGVTHIVIGRTRTRSIAERAVRMAVVPVVAVCPIVVVGAASPSVPPVRVVTPVPRRSPACPERIPEPVVDIRTVDIYRFDDVIGTIDVLITDNLCTDLSCCFILLHVDGCHILEHILSQYGLDNNQVLIVGRRLNYPQVIHYSVTVQIKIGKSGVGVIEECLKFLHVLNRSEQGSHRFQVERLAYVLRVGSNRDGLICPRAPANCSQKCEK